MSIKQWYCFYREVLSQSLLLHPITLGGPGITVELDETCFGHKRKYNRGYIRGSGQKWIFGMIDLSMQKCHLQIVENRERNTLFPIILRHVALGTQIHSDEASVYFTLRQQGYIHKTVKHKDNYVNPIDGTHTNNIENFWYHLKTKFREMHGCNNLPLRLDEYIYRWNCRKEDVFIKILIDISEQYPV